MAVIVMSHKELARLEVLRDLGTGRIGVDDAARRMTISRRQTFRLLAAFRRGGPETLVSSRRGRPSNRRLPEDLRRLAMALARERYADFGPTLAAEKLAELHRDRRRICAEGWRAALGRPEAAFCAPRPTHTPSRARAGASRATAARKAAGSPRAAS